jgi:asparagine synthase (glutamine-hydrolysing)
MVLSGDGGDEAFGGYDTYGSFLAIESARDVARAIRQAPVDGAHRAARGFRQRLTGSFKPRLSDWQRCMTYFSPGETRSLWRPEFRALAATASTDRAAQAARLAPTHDPLGFAQSIDYDGYLPDDILTKVDIASMAHGLEVRTPLVDRCVVEFASRLPLNQRVRRSADGTVIPKFLLRQLLSHRFSDAFVNRPKRGFLAPHARWFLEHPPTRKLLQRLLLDTASPLHRVFQAERLRGEFNAHTSERDNSSKLWLLLMLGLWLDGEPGVRLA